MVAPDLAVHTLLNHARYVEGQKQHSPDTVWTKGYELEQPEPTIASH